MARDAACEPCQRVVPVAGPVAGLALEAAIKTAANSLASNAATLDSLSSASTIANVQSIAGEMELGSLGYLIRVSLPLTIMRITWHYIYYDYCWRLCPLAILHRQFQPCVTLRLMVFTCPCSYLHQLVGCQLRPLLPLQPAQTSSATSPDTAYDSCYAATLKANTTTLQHC